MLVNDGIFMYAGQAVSDWNRNYVKDLFAKHKFHFSRTKSHAETAELFYDIQIRVSRSEVLVTIQTNSNNGNDLSSWYELNILRGRIAYA